MLSRAFKLILFLLCCPLLTQAQFTKERDGFEVVSIAIPAGESSVTALYFLDDSLGYAVGESNTLYFTNDRGLNWSEQTSNTPFEAEDLKVFSVEYIQSNTSLDFVTRIGLSDGKVTMGRSIFGSPGFSFMDPELISYSMPGNTFFDCFTIDNNRFLAVGSNGFMLFSEDGILDSARFTYTDPFYRNGIQMPIILSDQTSDTSLVFAIDDGQTSRVFMMDNVFDLTNYRLIHATQPAEYSRVHSLYFSDPDNGVIGIDPLNREHISVIRPTSIGSKYCNGQTPFENVTGPNGLLPFDTLYCAVEMRQGGNANHLTNDGGNTFELSTEVTYFDRVYSYDFSSTGSGPLFYAANLGQSDELLFILRTTDGGASLVDNSRGTLKSRSLGNPLSLDENHTCIRAGQNVILYAGNQIHYLDYTPSAPRKLTAFYQQSNQVALSWELSANSSTGFDLSIERAADGLNFEQIATLPYGDISFLDTTANAANTIQYTYRVAVADDNGVIISAYDSQTYPLPPANITMQKTGEVVVLNWTNEAIGWPDGDNVIERAVVTADGNLSFQPIARLWNQRNSYTFTETDNADVVYRVTREGIFAVVIDGQPLPLFITTTSPSFPASGQNWLTSTTENRPFGSVFNVGTDSVWAVGGQGMILFSDDAGLTWSEQVSGTNRRLYDVFMLNTLKGYAVGDEGILLTTNDGGATWSLSTPSSERFSSVAFFNDDIGLIGGNAGILLQTNDGGQTWLPNTFQDRIFFEVALGSTSDFWAVGLGGVLVSYDGGNSFQPSLTLPSTDTLRAVAFPSQQIGYVCGDNGLVYTTKNQGASWESITLPTTENLNSITFVTEKLGYLAGDIGTLFKTINGGLTWIQVNTGVTGDIVKIHQGRVGFSTFFASNVGLDGTITVDQFLSPPLQPNLFDLVDIVSDTSLRVSWSLENNETVGVYLLERADSTQPLVFEQIATVPLNVGTFTDTTAVASTSYAYRLRAQNARGFSSYSNTIFTDFSCGLSEPRASQTDYVFCTNEQFTIDIDDVSRASGYFWEVSDTNHLEMVGNDTTMISENTFRVKSDFSGSLPIQVGAFNGCISTSPLVLSVRQAAIDLGVLIQPALNYTTDNGSVFVQQTGGKSADFTAVLDQQSLIGDVNGVTFENLAGGSYSLEVIDNNNCRADTLIEVPFGNVWAVRVDTSNVIGDSTLLTIRFQGGNPPFSINLNGSFIGNSDGSDTSFFVANGTQDFLFLSASGSIVQREVIVDNSSGNVTCPPINTALNIITSTGGDCREPDISGTFADTDPSYVYSIDGGFTYQTNPTFQLVAGQDYIPAVQILTNGCEEIGGSLTTDIPEYFKVELLEVTPNVTCAFQNRDSEVSIRVINTLTGDTVTNDLVNSFINNVPFINIFNLTTASSANPYGLSEGVLSELDAADYQLFITQNQSPAVFCSDTIFFSVTDTTYTLELQVLEERGISCEGRTDGRLALQINSGFAPFTVAQIDTTFSTVERTIDYQNLPDTSISFTITDAFGCNNARTLTATEPFFNGFSSAGIICPEDTAVAEVYITGPTSFYSYSLDSGATLIPLGYNRDTVIFDPFFPPRTEKLPLFISGLQPGDNRIDFLSADGCANSIIVNVFSLLPEFTLIEPSCAGGTGALIVDQGFDVLYDKVFLYQDSVLVDSVVDLAITFTPEIHFKNLVSGSFYQITGEKNPFSPYDCDLDYSFILSEPDSVNTFLFTSVSPTCPMGNDASLRIEAGNDSLFTFDLLRINPTDTSLVTSIPNSNAHTFSNLEPGDYLIQTAADTFNTCSVTLEVELADTEIDFDVTNRLVNIDCKDSLSGAITMEVIGATNEAFLYSIDSGITFTPGLADNAFRFEELASGTYSTVVKDASDCRILRDTVELEEPSTSLSLELDAVTNLGCIGDTALVAATAVGGQPFSNGSYNYTLIAPNFTTTFGLIDSISSATIFPGEYYAFATDAFGCTAEDALVLTVADSIQIVADVMNEFCNEGNDGLISLAVSGGNRPYQYSLDSITFISDSIFSNLSDSVYTIHVADAGGCTALLDSVRVLPTQNPLEIVINQIIQVNAMNPLGSMDVSVNNAEVPFTIDLVLTPTVIDTRIINTLAEANNIVFNDLVAGEYTLVVRGARNGCADFSDTITIRQEGDFALSAAATQEVTCFNGEDGIVELSVLPEPSSVVYYINDFNSPQTDSIFASLSAGSYTFNAIVNGTDTVSTQLSLVNPEALVIATAAIGTSCFGTADGAIVATASGQGTNYSFTLDNNTTTLLNDSIQNLSAGTYRVAVFNELGCADSSLVNVPEPDAVQTTLNAQDSVLCSSNDSITVQLNVVGGSGNYQTIWLNGNGFLPYTNNDFVLTNSAGVQRIAVSDDQDCFSEEDTLTIISDILEAEYDSVSSPLCFGDGSGFIGLNITGGQSIYAISVNNQPVIQSDGVFDNLILGTYNFSVSNSSGCVVALSDTLLSNPERLSFNIVGINDPGCENSPEGTILVQSTGGTGDVLYVVNGTTTAANNGALDNLPVGSYSISATDANGCSTPAQTATLNANTTISVDSRFLIPDTVGTSDFIVLTELINPKPDSLLWQISGLSQQFNNDTLLSFSTAGEYTISLIGFYSGCTAREEKTIQVIDGFVVQQLDTSNFVAILQTSLVPNPSSGAATLFVELNNEEELLVTVMSSQGRILQELIAPSATLHEIPLDLTSFSIGTYYLSVRTLAGSAVTEVLIKN